MLKPLKHTIRYFIGVLLLSTAIGKLLDIQGFAKVVDSYQVFSGWITAPIGLAMSLTELGLAIWLFSGKKLGLAALIAAGMHGSFIIWILIAMARGLEILNCGCFGVFLARPMGWITVAEDAFMLTLSLILYFLEKQEK